MADILTNIDSIGRLETVLQQIPLVLLLQISENFIVLCNINNKKSW